MTEKKNSTMVRASRDDADKIQSLSRKISNVENKKIEGPEVIRRTFNIPSLADQLVRDAEMKRQRK